MRIILTFCFLLTAFQCVHLHGQQIKQVLTPSDVPDVATCKKLLTHKIIPMELRTQALLALAHYPELQNIKIEFRIRNNKTPLTSRPTLWSTLSQTAVKRTYLITVSQKSNALFNPILFRNLPFNAQVGVLGHELAHTVAFSKLGFIGMVKVLIGQLSSKYLDKMEYDTDQRTIDHGLAWQLLDWSIYVRKKLNISLWKGIHEKEMKNERYMNPETIISKIKANKMYHE